MKKLSFLFVFICLLACTSNTIFEKPKDLIPKDTMSLLIQELTIASSSKFLKNKNFEKKVNYMPLVYDQFKIDSTRFQTSNLYYMSTIDDYEAIMKDAKTSLENLKSTFDKIKKKKDSLRRDSLEKIKVVKLKKKEMDSVEKKALNFKDTLLLKNDNNTKF